MSKIAVEIKDLHKKFEKGTANENHVLKGIDLTINKGDFITIIGGNGAGKSTLLNSIAGSFPIDQGTIEIAGKNISKLAEHQRAAFIGRVFQDTKSGTAPRMTIGENLAMAYRRGKNRGLKRGSNKEEREFFKERLKRLNLGLEDRLDTEIGILSGGQRQVITLLMATFHQPDLLLLDEHTAALDPATARNIMNITEETIHQQALTSLMITHNMKDALKYGNRLIMLHQGKVVADVSGPEKSALTIEKVLSLFEKVAGQDALQDEMILS